MDLPLDGWPKLRDTGGQTEELADVADGDGGVRQA